MGFKSLLRSVCYYSSADVAGFVGDFGLILASYGTPGSSNLGLQFRGFDAGSLAGLLLRGA